MGIAEVIKQAFLGAKGSWPKKTQSQKCPNCGEKITLDLERCPKCGIHIKSMFRRKCPKCNMLNDVNNKSCFKCSYSFEDESERAKKTYYICPICGYKSEVYLTQCAACNTRFV